MAPLIVLTQGGGIDLTSACRAPAAGHWPNTLPMCPLEDLVSLEPRMHCIRYRSPSTLWVCYLLADDLRPSTPQPKAGNPDREGTLLTGKLDGRLRTSPRQTTESPHHTLRHNVPPLYKA